MEHKRFFFFLYKHILLAYKWFSIISEVSLCFSYFFFMWGQFDIYWYILEAGGFCAFMPIFIVEGGGANVRGEAYVLHSHSRGVDRGVLSPFSLFPFSHPSSPFSHPLFSFSPLCLGLRFGLSRSEVRNWSLPKSAKISVGWKVKR